MAWNMSEPYPMFNASQATSLTGVMEYVDSVLAPGMLGFILLFMIFGISFLTFGGLPMDKRVLTTMGVCSVMAVMLTIAGLLGSFYAPTIIILTFIAWVLVKE